MKQRIIYFDAIRTVACLMVILMHSPRPFSAVGPVLSGITFLTSPCIGLFFMISGALLIPLSKPVKQFLCQRLSKIMIPAVLWSLFYLVVQFYQTGDSDTLLWSVLSVPFSVQGCGIYWFIYVLAGLYLLAPVLSRWLQKASKREIEFYLSLWTVTLCYPVLGQQLGINDGTTGLLYYFSGYAGYFLLGYYLHNYPPPYRWRRCITALLLVCPLAFAAVCKLSGFPENYFSLFWYLSLPAVSMCSGIFMLTRDIFEGRKMNPLAEKILTDFSDCSFGIYLVYFAIMRRFIWNFVPELLPGGGGIAETFMLTVALSWGIVHLISEIPGAEYITGFRRR